jgi:lipoyl(octanoyl) transferase
MRSSDPPVLAAADIAYAREAFVPLADLCERRGEDPARVDAEIEAGRLPRPSYVLGDGTELVPEEYFALSDEAGGLQAVGAAFAARYEAAAARERVPLPSAEDEWQEYLSGLYGVCLKHVSPETIVRKSALVLELEALLEDPKPDDELWARELRTGVDELDALERPFAPDYDRLRFGGPSSRDRLITAPRERYPEIFAARWSHAPIRAYVMQLGLVPYREAWDLQRSVATAVSDGSLPDTILLLEHPPVVTLGRRADSASELHIPEGAEVELVETDRGGKSTFHGPGQLVCYPILDLGRHGRDVKKYVRDLEEALIATLDALGVTGDRIGGLTGVWLTRPPRKIASIGVHVSRWVTTHGYALNVDLDPAPFTEWITACGLEDAAFTTIACELGRPVTVDEVRPHALAALERVFGLELEELPAGAGAGLRPHEQVAARS